MRARVVVVVVAVVCAVVGACSPSWPAGLQLAPPAQTTLGADARPFLHKGHVVTPRAGYALDALVLSKEAYRADENADVSPVDLAVGWGPMATKEVLSQLRVRQNGRYFFWSSSSSLPVPREEIERSAANIHLIWRDKKVGDVVDALDAGDVVHLEGSLVDVTFKDGHEMKTSLARDDTGGGACEVFFVDAAVVR